MNKYTKYETYSTILWLLMDFCWMSNYNTLAITASIFSIIFSILALLHYTGGKITEKLLLSACYIWVIMNTVWMVGEITSHPWMITIAKGLFGLATIIVLCAMYIAKKNNENLDFKRIKL